MAGAGHGDGRHHRRGRLLLYSARHQNETREQRRQNAQGIGDHRVCYQLYYLWLTEQKREGANVKRGLFRFNTWYKSGKHLQGPRIIRNFVKAIRKARMDRLFSYRSEEAPWHNKTEWTNVIGTKD